LFAKRARAFNVTKNRDQAKTTVQSAVSDLCLASQALKFSKPGLDL